MLIQSGIADKIPQCNDLPKSFNMKFQTNFFFRFRLQLNLFFLKKFLFLKIEKVFLLRNRYEIPLCLSTSLAIKI